LFDRSRSGYKPTDAGALLLEQARGMADQAEEIERRVLGRDRELTGPLRLATAFVVMEHLLPQPLADFAQAYPGIEVEVVENAFLVDLARRQAEDAPGPTQLQADVALRLSTHVSEHLVGRQLGMTHCRAYALRGAPGLPQAITPLPQLLREAPWVAFERDGHHRVYDHWMRKHLAQSDVRVRVDIFNAAAAMLRTGVGIGILPSFMQARHPELLPVSDVIPEMSVPVWMLTHPDLRQTARVRVFMSLVGDALAQRLQAGGSAADPA
jgi:DNA-binding transcriptional LysR family regulator